VSPIEYGDKVASPTPMLISCRPGPNGDLSRTDGIGSVDNVQGAEPVCESALNTFLCADMPEGARLPAMQMEASDMMLSEFLVMEDESDGTVDSPETKLLGHKPASTDMAIEATQEKHVFDNAKFQETLEEFLSVESQMKDEMHTSALLAQMTLQPTIDELLVETGVQDSMMAERVAIEKGDDTPLAETSHPWAGSYAFVAGFTVFASFFGPSWVFIACAVSRSLLTVLRTKSVLLEAGHHRLHASEVCERHGITRSDPAVCDHPQHLAPEICERRDGARSSHNVCYSCGFELLPADPVVLVCALGGSHIHCTAATIPRVLNAAWLCSCLDCYDSDRLYEENLAWELFDDQRQSEF